MIPEGDMSGLLAQAQAMQEQLLNAQQELAEMQIEGSAGGDLVTATVTGSGELVGLRGAVQEREAGVGVQLDHARCAYQRPWRRSHKTTVLRPSSSTRS